MKQPTMKQLTAQIDQWNAANPIGTPVNVVMDDGEIRETKTRSAAGILSGHTAVIYVDGIAGCYLLSRVTRRQA